MKVSTVEPVARGQDVIRLRVAFSENDLRIRETPYGLIVQLAGFHSNAGEPGAPALPRTTIHVALPEGTWPAGFDVAESRTIRLNEEPQLVAPVQPLRPGAGGGPPGRKAHTRKDRQDDDERPRRDPSADQDEDEFTAEPIPAPAIVPPDPERYNAAARDPRIARPSALNQLGPSPILAVELRPIRLTDRGLLEFVTEFELIVAYGPRPAPDEKGRDEAIEQLRKRGTDIDPARVVPIPESKVVSRAQAKRLGELARDLVVNPEMIRDWWPYFPVLDLPADYLVVTDNQTWDADAIAPTGPVSGDIVASFQRLAAWKRSRGVTAKVVTVSDIVAGRYGDFRTGSRDLPEVIRRFLKWAHEHWGVAWLLVGGDVGIVPARLAAGALEGHMDLTADDPPGDNKSHWTGSFLKMHVVGPGTWWPGAWDRILVNSATGQLIPFDATGASAGGGLGWYYTTSDTYATRATMATTFVRVNGPASALNATLQWLYQWNRIPTDFYYASLTSWVIAYQEIDLWLFTLQIPYVYFPPHDWDALDNGLYGQYVGGSDVDGVLWRTDLSVGRAPVQAAVEADAFVDKVISYERFRAPDGSWLDGDWPRRLLIASSNWGDPVTVSPTPSSPPGDNRFHTGSGLTVIRLKDTPSDFERQLIADISDADRRELPWNVGGGTARGWHYATSATNHTPPNLTITFFWFSITFPLPSQWIVVHGPAEELNPRWYLFDHTGQDGSMSDQEQLREQLRTEVPGWDQVTRLYKDETDLTPAQAAAAPVLHLTSGRIRDAMNAGPHIVSLSGHGNSDGCCGAGAWMAAALTNGWHSFIGYADSCLTNQIDSEDAFSEELLKNASGGAVAYVGNTRFSWISAGDDVQRAFFHRLTTTRHLGLLNDSKVYALDFGYWHAYARWIMYALNLLGDPEMPVWRSRRRRLYVDVRWKGRIDVPLRIKVRPPRPGEPNEEIVVHLRQGEREWLAHLDVDNVATFDVSGAGTEELMLTVSGVDAIPFMQRLVVQGPVWVTGVVRAVLHRDDGRNRTRVVLESPAGLRTFVAEGGSPDYAIIVDAVTDAYTSGESIGLLVDRLDTNARIERFRFLRAGPS